MDMKEIFDNGCFSPYWLETRDEAAVPEEVVPHRKNVEQLLDELSEIKQNMENIKEKLWYLGRARQYNEAGFNAE